MDATQERKGEGGRERGDGERQEEERHSTMMRISIWRRRDLLLCGSSADAGMAAEAPGALYLMGVVM